MTPEQVQQTLHRLAGGAVRRVELELERDTAAATDPATVATRLLGELEPRQRLESAAATVLQVRPGRVGEKITYKYRVLYEFVIVING